MKNRRRRAFGFLALAATAALAAATLAAGYGSSVARGYGPLRSVVVAAEPLDAGSSIDPRRAATALAVRRVPARFVPPGALFDPSQALGLAPMANLPAGGYLLGTQLRPPRRGGAATTLGPRRSPVEIAVTGAGSLLTGGSPPPGARVDVVVVEEPRGAGPGRTRIEASGVPLISLSPGHGHAASATAILGLTRGQALRLISAQSFARQVTLLPAPAAHSERG